jgi:hypothetical protein
MHTQRTTEPYILPFLFIIRLRKKMKRSSTAKYSTTEEKNNGNADFSFVATCRQYTFWWWWRCCLLRGCDLRVGRQSSLARTAPLSIRHSCRRRALPRCQHAIRGAVAFSAATDLQDMLTALKMLLAPMKGTVTCWYTIEYCIALRSATLPSLRRIEPEPARPYPIITAQIWKRKPSHA